MKTLFDSSCGKARFRTLMTRSFASLLFAAFIAACSPDNSAPTPDGGTITYQMMRTSFNSLEGEWVLTNYQNAPLSANLQNKATLTLTKQSDNTMRLGGRSFVNYYGGAFTLDETKGLIVSNEPIIQTLIGASTELMDAESRHLEGLEKASAFELTTNGQLKLYLGDKANSSTEVMIYSRK